MRVATAPANFMFIIDKAIDLASNFFGTVKEFIGYQSKKLDLKNTEPVKKAAAAQKERDAINTTENAIEQKDVNEIQNEISEL